MEPYEFRLSEGEKVEYKAKLSKAAIIMIWAVIPAVFLVIFLTAYLPVLIRYSVEEELRNILFEELGIEGLDFGSMRDALYMTVFSALPAGFVRFVSGFMAAILTLLVLAWLGWASVYTYMNLRYALIITDTRVFAKAKDKVFQADFVDIVNVATAQSLFGKIFRYGEINIQTQKDAITVCNIANAKSLETVLWSKAEK